MYWQSYEGQVRHFWPPEERKARKEHKCLECGKTIPIGSSYWHFCGKWGGEVKAWDVCLECEEDWSGIIRIFHYYGELEARIIYGLIVEAVQDALDAGYLKGYSPLVEKWLSTPEERAISQMRAHSRLLL